MKKITIKEGNGKNKLIEINEVKKFLKSNDNQLTLIFESGKTDDKYRKSLQKELKEYHVFNVRWLPEIWIYPSIKTDKILEKEEEIFEAANSFRKDGIRLMKILGDTYQIRACLKF